MITKVIETIRKHNLLKKGDKVIVALSGGVDSVVLLDVMLKLKDEFSLTVMAAHVNHLLRGEESFRDENFVTELCKKINTELFLRRVDVNALSKETGEGFELQGRRVRYEFFEELSKEYGAITATAHTLSDSAETALLNIARGASLAGLSSIPYIRGKIIRPLLDVTREEIEAYAKENELDFVDDSTNFDADICNRNRVRHKVIPELKNVNSSFEENYSKLRDMISQVDLYMNSQAQVALADAETKHGYCCEKLSLLQPALKKYALKLIADRSGASVEQRHIELMGEILLKGGAVNLVGGYKAIARQGFLRITKETSAEKAEIPFEKGMKFAFSQKEYSLEEYQENDIVNKKLATLCVGCDKISGDVLIRTRKQGDRFALVNRNITKDLRKLQNELKIPAEKRDSLLLLAKGSTILWAEEIGVSREGKYEKGNGLYILVREDKDYA